MIQAVHHLHHLMRTPFRCRRRTTWTGIITQVYFVENVLVIHRGECNSNEVLLFSHGVAMFRLHTASLVEAMRSTYYASPMRHLITALIGGFFADTPCLDGFFSGTRGSVTLQMCFLVVFRNVAIRTKWRHRDGNSLILYRYSLQNRCFRKTSWKPHRGNFPQIFFLFLNTNTM